MPPEDTTAQASILKKLKGFFLRPPTAGPSECCPLCGGYPDAVSLVNTIDTRKIIERIAREIHSGDLPVETTDSDLALLTGDLLMNALKTNFKGIETLSVRDVSRLRWINRQQNNLYKFGMAKSYTQMKAMRDEILGEDGNVLPFTEFLSRAMKIDQDYNKTYLETEHMAVVRGTVMGSRWLEIEDQKDVAPLLEYVTAGDDCVREEHRSLAGLIEPVDSTFWNQYYPPNGWRCRCSVRQLSYREASQRGYGGDQTDADSRMAARLVKDKYWRKNVGKTTILEANGTVYIESVPGRGFKQLKAIDHYGLKSYDQIRSSSKLPSPDRMSDQQFESFWKWNQNKGVIETRDFSKMPVLLDEKFKAHLLKDEKHYGVAGELLSTLKSPDEVWENIKGGSHRQDWFRAYLKFCEPNPIVLLVDDQNRAVTFYEIDKAANDSFRTGVLLKKK